MLEPNYESSRDLSMSGPFYRGTQLRRVKGVHKLPTYTPSLPVAVIWSSEPPDWNRAASFLPTSSVHQIRTDIRNPLILSQENYESLSSILRSLRYGTPEGISIDEVVRIYNYLHNREIGKARGGQFNYKGYNVYEDFEEVDDYDVPLSIIRPQTRISWYLRDAFEDEPSIRTAQNLEADTFIFADTPAVQRAAIALGYDALFYPDVFAGGTVSEELLGCPVEFLDDVWEDMDIEMDDVPSHWSVRILDPRVIKQTITTPTEVILETHDLCSEWHEYQRELAEEEG